jgi:hypothetical protein
LCTSKASKASKIELPVAPLLRRPFVPARSVRMETATRAPLAPLSFFFCHFFLLAGTPHTSASVSIRQHTHPSSPSQLGSTTPTPTRAVSSEYEFAPLAAGASELTPSHVAERTSACRRKSNKRPFPLVRYSPSVAPAFRDPLGLCKTSRASGTFSTTQLIGGFQSMKY